MTDLTKSLAENAPEGSVVLTRIVMERVLFPDGQDTVYYMAEDRDGETPPLIEMLGLLEMGKATAWEQAAGVYGPEDED